VQYEGGAMVVVGAGMKTAASGGVDSNGACSVVQTNCFVVGPLFAAQTYAGGSVSTGVFKRGDESRSLGVLGSATAGLGILKDLQFASDGGVQYGTAATGGAAIGLGVQVCKQVLLAKGCN
jgi:hypothetical protein